MRFEIRQAAPADASAACALLRRSIEIGCKADHDGKPAVLEAWLGNKTAANVTAWFSSTSNYAIVAEGEDGVLLGLCLLTQAGKVALCYVLPEALHTGVGRALLDAVEQQARAWSIKKLFLHSPPSASTFFERQGFVNAGKDTSCFGLDSDLLWKSLEGNCEMAPGAARKRFCNCNG